MYPNLLDAASLSCLTTVTGNIIDQNIDGDFVSLKSEQEDHLGMIPQTSISN